jgi:hypothetical protein
MVRLSAYTGQMVAMNDLIKTETSPFYNLECKPTPADFEKDGDVAMPQYGDDQCPLPGVKWADRNKAKA